MRLRGAAAVQAWQCNLEHLFRYLKQLVSLLGLIGSEDSLQPGSVCLNQAQAIEDIGQLRIPADR